MCWIMYNQSEKLMFKCNLPVFLTLTSPVNEDNVDWLTCPVGHVLQDFFKNKRHKKSLTSFTWKSKQINIPAIDTCESTFLWHHDKPTVVISMKTKPNILDWNRLNLASSLNVLGFTLSQGGKLCSWNNFSDTDKETRRQLDKLDQQIYQQNNYSLL